MGLIDSTEESLLLLLFGYIEPELQNAVAVLRQMFFVIANGAIGLFPKLRSFFESRGF